MNILLSLFPLVNKGHVYICYEYLQHSVAFWRGRLKVAYLSGKLLFVIHLGAVASVACQPLIRVRPKHVPVPLLCRLCWKERLLWSGKEIWCIWTLLVLQ